MHGVGQRHQHRNRGERAHAGQNADQIADQDAEKGPHEVLRLKRDTKPVPEIVERLIHCLSPK